DDRIAGAVHDSQDDPAGACGAGGQWCAGVAVQDAQFSDAWAAFANTREGSAVRVPVGPSVTVTFTAVDARGATGVTTSPGAPAPPPFQRFRGAPDYDVETTAGYSGPVEVCIAYDAAAYDGYAPRLFSLSPGGWADATTTVGPAAVCGSAASLGVFAVLAGDPTPPAIVPHLAGPHGN